jgi:hypothetical protein
VSAAEHFKWYGVLRYEEGEELMAEGREIVMAFSNYTARLSKRIRFRCYTPREIGAFIKTDRQDKVDE